MVDGMWCFLDGFTLCVAFYLRYQLCLLIRTTYIELYTILLHSFIVGDVRSDDMDQLQGSTLRFPGHMM